MCAAADLTPVRVAGGWRGEAVSQDSDLYILLASKADEA
jgi:hypothetical protein